MKPQKIAHSSRRIPALTAGFFLMGVLALGGSVPSLAGVGTGTSASATVDTRLPDLTIAIDPAGDLFQGGQWFQATVTTSDDHPGLAPDDHFLVAWVDQAAVDTLLFDPAAQPAVIDWQAPEVASAHVRLAAYSRDAFGNIGEAVTFEFTVIPSVTDVPAGPDRFRLGPGFPNPFNPVVNFAVDLPSDGRFSMKVYDAKGHLVRTLEDGRRAAGTHRFTWNGTSDQGTRCAGGTYLVTSEFGGAIGKTRLSRKVLLLP